MSFISLFAAAALAAMAPAPPVAVLPSPASQAPATSPPTAPQAAAAPAPIVPQAAAAPAPIVEELFAATRAGDAARVTAALDKGADVNARTRYGATALMFAAVGLGVPLYLVTMASQNLPGFAVLRASGYQPPTQAVLAATGAASLATAFLGAHTSNLAAISAALCTGPEAHPDPGQRWKAGVFYALWWGLIGLFGASLVGLFARAAAGLAGHGRRHRPAGLDGRRHGRCPLGRSGSLRRGRHARRHRFGRHADGRRLGVLGAGLRPHRVRHRPLRQALAGAGKRAA